jgi:RHS repeat-associated protein
MKKNILTEEGRVMVNEGNTYEYQYFLKDHLGNTRVTFTENDEIIQEDAYYPFGMQMNGLCHKTGTDYLNKYLYNGKELQDDFGLDWYDYGARFYDATLGRWHVVDPMTEEACGWSPYNYTYNNSINLIDPDGRTAVNGIDWWENENTGEIMNIKGKNELPENEREKGWINVGKDNMFGNENIPEYDKTNYFPLAAKMFMGKQGFKLVPKQVLVYNKEIQDSPVSTGKHSVSITRGKQITYGLTATYVNNDFIVTNRTNTKTSHHQMKYNILLGSLTTEEIYRETLQYGPKEFTYYLGKFYEFSSVISGKHNYQTKYSFNKWDYLFNKISDVLINPSDVLTLPKE